MAKRIAKWDRGLESREMARADNWVMVRRPGCTPYTMFAKEWDALPSVEEGRRLDAEYRAALRERE
ncbi:hypothetical protein [Brucella sp. 2280]|uniref:hypothetical protein n=1 Tax=Brucella sp. 2280 TaxID=2592625 RepID=UPI001295FCAC|nr:hypothetical protein [Brucella sp. 2280]QGA55910.1 hypothetical protein GHC20_01920 [Brucella sp. 2280]